MKRTTAPISPGGSQPGEVCHMEWAADDRSRVDDLIEFETRVNDVRAVTTML